MDKNSANNHPGMVVRHVRERRRRLVPRVVPVLDPYHLLEYDLPGVEKVIISSEAQKVLHCTFGVDMTIQNLWKYIEKNLFNEFLNSEFYQLKDKIAKYPRDHLLVGYIPDDNRDYDKFNICLIEKAEDEIKELVQKINQDTQDSLINLVNKKPRIWKSFGSEIEVQELNPYMNRLLLRVEVETMFPYVKSNRVFRLRFSENARDGYAEILNTKTTFDVVKRGCIDSFAQRSPYTILNECQTHITFLRNATTQYEYKPAEIKKSSLVKVNHFITQKLGDVCGNVLVNGYINFYSNDYKRLVFDDRYSAGVDMTLTTPYSFLFDNAIGTSKKIGKICFHPMWSGTMTVVYLNYPPSSYRTRHLKFNEVIDAIYHVQPVSLWSFKDCLNPTLLLETPREVSEISFCPYDENIIVGGCISGQVLVWDIKDKLRDVETEEILTDDQKRYRIILNGLTTWIKNVKNAKRVRPAIASNVFFSHTSSVTSIAWIPSLREIGANGRVNDIPADTNRTSLQFSTFSKDGTLLVWDLNQQPVLDPSSQKTKANSSRSQKRPPALSESKSPYQSLNRVFKPIFKINIVVPDTTRPCGLSTAIMRNPRSLYVERHPNPKRKFKIDNRIIYDYVQAPVDLTIKTNSLVAGSIEGDFIVATWEGLDYTSAAEIGQEWAKTANNARIHDGPVLSLCRNEIDPDVILTVGGKIFALWNTKFLGRPIFWKRCDCRYTHGSFSLTHPSVFLLCRSDGKIECWHLKVRSDRYMFTQETSGTTVSTLAAHELPMLNNVIAIADEKSWIKLYYLSNTFNQIIKEDRKFFTDYCAREINRKELFLKWQTEWNTKHPSVQQPQEEVKRDEAPKPEQTGVNNQGETATSKGVKLSFEKRGEMKWKSDNEQRMKTKVLEFKKIDMNLVKKQQLPALLAAETEEKAKVIRNLHINNVGKLVNDAIEANFPEILKVKRSRPPDPYAGGDSLEDRLVHYHNYQNLANDCDRFIEDNPHKLSFHWADIISAAKARYKILMRTKPRRRRRSSDDNLSSEISGTTSEDVDDTET